jgi:hypothetical protein
MGKEWSCLTSFYRNIQELLNHRRMARIALKRPVAGTGDTHHPVRPITAQKLEGIPPHVRLEPGMEPAAVAVHGIRRSVGVASVYLEGIT